MSVSETAEKINSMEVRGALRIAVEAARALEEELVNGASYDELVRAGDVLRDARPTAVSLPNSINYVLHLAESHKDNDPVVAKPMLLADISDFISKLEGSLDKIAEYGANLIEEGDVLLTICNSHTVTEIMKRAWADGKRFKVYACETRPRLQGHITVKDLQATGVDVTLIVDSAAYHTMIHKDVKKVFVGADTVYSNGDVINKIGTSQVALTAKHSGAEFIVCTSSIKFSPFSVHGEVVEIEERDASEVAELPGVKVFNPAFDITPKEHVNMIVTEDGVIPPEAAYQVLKDRFGWSLG
ncbi:MAG: ribose 1,5-bisphosphate isomerase [Candidatus Altiarchaeales archaeon]|nr:ribose 1,5-bisphosphate isomerase [Candidatus Altiarchaeales archaeon]MBD3416514.1 ribose 1,5-bisphosphate isomerase [Candidatus Altiarchaeales archaeon]